GVDDALVATQSTAVKAQDMASAKKDNVTLQVVTPIPTVAQNSQSTSIKFVFDGIPGMNVIDKKAWDRVVKEFNNTYPQIQVTVVPPDKMDEPLWKDDCFYFNSFNLPDRIGYLKTLSLPLDPLIAADKDFDKSDFIGNILNQSQIDGQMFGYPLTIEPSVLKI